MIELFSANTPNGKKISIMLEEIGYEFKITKVDISKDEQFKPEFKKISPFSKIPVIIDHKNDRTNVNQWLMAQMGYIGPMLGQHHQFHHYNPGKSEFGEERYFKISKRIYSEVDEVLSKTKFLAGDEYSIADIATFPWFARHEWHDIGIQNFKNLSRWYEEISKRDGVQKGYAFMDKSEVIPKINY